jgi:hypothetical protein
MTTEHLSTQAARVRDTVESSLKRTIDRELAEDSQISRLMYSKSTHSKSATNTGARQREKALLNIDEGIVDRIAARLSGADREG